VELNRPTAIEPYLRALIDHGGSDLHIKAGVVPRIRIDGTLRPLRSEPLSEAVTDQMLAEIIRVDLVDEFAQTGEADFAIMVDGVGRFRVNAFRQRGHVGLVFRHVAIGAPALESLGLPAPVSALALQPRGSSSSPVPPVPARARPRPA
jgi:twitching motility protein PilT